MRMKRSIIATLHQRSLLGNRRCAVSSPQHLLAEFLEEKFASSQLSSKKYDTPSGSTSTFVLAVSPDRSKIASAHGDHTVKIFRCFDGTLLQTLPGHPRSPWCIAFHPTNNDLLASGCLGRQVRVWDLKTGACELYIPESRKVVASLAFHPDADVLLVASGNKIYFWRWNEGDTIHTIQTRLPQESIRVVRFHPTYKWLMTAVMNVSEHSPCERTYLEVSTTGNEGTGQHMVQTVSCVKMGMPSASVPTESLAQRQNRRSGEAMAETVANAKKSLATQTVVSSCFHENRPTSSSTLSGGRTASQQTCAGNTESHQIDNGSSNMSITSDRAQPDSMNRRPERSCTSMGRHNQFDVSSVETRTRSHVTSTQETEPRTNSNQNRNVALDDGIQNTTVQRNQSSSDQLARMISSVSSDPLLQDTATWSLPLARVHTLLSRTGTGRHTTVDRLSMQPNTITTQSSTPTEINVRSVRSQGITDRPSTRVNRRAYQTPEFSVSGAVNVVPPESLAYPSGPDYSTCVYSWHDTEAPAIAAATAQTENHVHTAVVIAMRENVNPDQALETAINRALVGAYAGLGETAVASNIINTSHRIQLWEADKLSCMKELDATTRVIVSQCKIHNDCSVDISQDGRYLAAFVAGEGGFPSEGRVSLFSLTPSNFGQCVFKRSYGPNAVSVSISPLSKYLLVGLASKRSHVQSRSTELIADVIEVTGNRKHKSEDKTKPIRTITHDMSRNVRSRISANVAIFHPSPGGGVLYGTNTGLVQHCTLRVEDPSQQSSLAKKLFY